MNILFFLTPKSETAYILRTDTVRQAMEKMEYHRYSCVPIIAEDGSYVGVITEGDLLWGVKNLSMVNMKEAERMSVMIINRKYDYRPVHVETTMDQLVERALNQNVVPVVDDQDNYIGIIRRREILQYLYDKLDAEGTISGADQPQAVIQRETMAPTKVTEIHPLRSEQPQAV